MDSTVGRRSGKKQASLWKSAEEERVKGRVAGIASGGKLVVDGRREEADAAGAGRGRQLLETITFLDYIAEDIVESCGQALGLLLLGLTRCFFLDYLEEAAIATPVASLFKAS